ncbi:glycosyltransferase [Cerasicoccus maritimus]|uniref:glycosyltransferase n=1 Tax=Cerasicoccus maritimus TaxID=490089 RepID=UPI002852B425|nr:glycosyltransferase [Cerasicoccus maritimus]
MKILLYEPEIKGHHLYFLKYISDAFHGEGHRIAIATTQEATRTFLEEAGVAAGIEWHIDVSFKPKKPLAAFHALASVMAASNCERLFLCCMDSYMSSLLRACAWGKQLPAELKGKVGGIFLRPNYLFDQQSGVSAFLKRRGFGNLYQSGCFTDFFYLDERLPALAEEKFPAIRHHALADPAAEVAKAPDQATAREKLGLDSDAIYLLHFGVGNKRKGLALLSDAFQQLPPDSKFKLLVAGKLEDDPIIQAPLEELKKQGRAYVWNERIAEKMTPVYFAAADWVSLLYQEHRGSSNVIARAAAAQRPVIGTDFDLLAERIRTHRLGLLAQLGSRDDLLKQLSNIEAGRATLTDPGYEEYAQLHSLEYFQQALAAFAG